MNLLDNTFLSVLIRVLDHMADIQNENDCRGRVPGPRKLTPHHALTLKAADLKCCDVLGRGPQLFPQPRGPGCAQAGDMLLREPPLLSPLTDSLSAVLKEPPPPSTRSKGALPMYLNGFPSLVSWLKVCSTTFVVH